jgi:hypothetical protein
MSIDAAIEKDVQRDRRIDPALKTIGQHDGDTEL